MGLCGLSVGSLVAEASLLRWVHPSGPNLHFIVGQPAPLRSLFTMASARTMSSPGDPDLIEQG